MSELPNGHPRDRLSEYLDDELDIEERSAIDRHLAVCEDCRAHLDALRRLARAIADEGVPPVPVDLKEKIAGRLDAATVLRPRRWRFAVPVTIAATLSAIGILVAIQWREGRLAVPPSAEPVRQPEIQDQKKLAAAPPPPAAPQEAAPRKEKQDFERARQKDVAAPVQNEPAPPAATGMVAGGVERDANALRADDALQRKAPLDEDRRSQELAKRSSEAAQIVGSASAAKAEAVSACADRWSDSGVRGTWEVRDAAAAVDQLDIIAHDVGGMGQWRGIEDGRPYLLIVPRSRFAEVFYALRARAIGGLLEPPALAAGDDCAALSITIVVASDAPKP